MGEPPTQAEVEAWWQLFHSISEQLGLADTHTHWSYAWDDKAWGHSDEAPTP